METLIDAIRAAVAPGASAEARAAGAQACRTILAALEAKPGEPLAAPTPAATTPVQAIVGALRTMPLDQLLDLTIAKLTAALPAGTEVPKVASLRVPIVSVNHLGGDHERG
jgi:hypothetical protein